MAPVKTKKSQKVMKVRAMGPVGYLVLGNRLTKFWGLHYEARLLVNPGNFWSNY